MKFEEEAVAKAGKLLNRSSILNLALCGAIATLLFLSFFLYLKYKEKIYLWFIAFLIFQFTQRFTNDFHNELFQFFFSESPRVLILLYIINTVISFIIMLQFWRVYINAKEKYPIIYKAIGFVMYSIIFSTIIGTSIRFSDWSFDYWFKIRQWIMLFNFFLLSFIMIYIFIKGTALAKFLSFGVLIVCAITILALVIINTNPNSLQHNWYLVISGFGMVSVLAFAMAFRFIALNEEKQMALLEKVKMEKLNSEQRLKIKLEQAEAQRLKELDDFKSRLYTNLTHEFRTPLTVILGMTDQLKSNPNKHLKQATRLIESNGKNLLLLINQLLDLSKLENQSFQLHNKSGNLVTYLRYIIESFQTFSNSKNLSLRFYSVPEKLEMDFDPEQIKQLMTNLISNAVKFTPSGGEIKIRLSKDDATQPKMALIAVIDNGVGISEKDLPHIFDRFYQVESADRHKEAGTGIGLAHTRELVKLMGGNILAKSEAGKGSEFLIQLPIKNDSAEKVELIEMDKSLGRLGINNKHIAAKQMTIDSKPNSQDLPNLLIIEDNADVVAYLKACLEDSYQLNVAYNGKIGIEKALENIPDLIISDVMMPEKDGFEVCETLKNDERSSHIPIILLTAKAGVESKITGLQRGADAYLAKPFNKEELLIRLEKLVERQQRMRTYFSKGQQNEDTSQFPKEIIAVEDVFIQKVRKIVAENYNDENFSLPSLCQKIRMSRSQLFRKMKALIGTSPSKFIRDYRLNQAKSLLENSDFNVSEVAWQCGFKDLSHFSKAFQEKFGILPSATNK